jgi:hypothetical protein
LAQPLRQPSLFSDLHAWQIIGSRQWIKEVGYGFSKGQMIKIVQDQPDDGSYDEILRELALARMIERGLEDSQAGRIISDEARD